MANLYSDKHNNENESNYNEAKAQSIFINV
jgi:hypothetical protein